MHGDDMCSVAMLEEMDSVAQSDSLPLPVLSRIEYCRASLLVTSGKTDEVEELARAMLGRLDSARYTYDYHAWAQILSVTDRDFINRHRVNVDNLRYFRSIGDSLQAVKSLITLSHMAMDMGDSALACSYFHAIDNLLCSDIRLDYLRRRMKVNEALVGSASRSDSLFRILRRDSVLGSDTESRIVILQNSFLYDDSVAHLDEAIRLAGAPLYIWRRPILYTLKSFWFESHGIPDSALVYARLAMDSRPADYPTPYDIETHRALAYAYKSNGMPDSAFSALSGMVSLEDKLDSERQTSKTLNAEYSKRLKLIDEKALLERKRGRSRTVIIVLCIMVIASVIVMRWQRIAARRHFELLSSKLDLRNAAHNLKTYSMVVEENERLFDEISQCIESPHSPDTLVASLRAVLRKHRITAEDRQLFVKIQCGTDAGFASRIKADFPGITELQIQLARLIAAGVTNSQLSRLLNVTPESVHKSRYRLRLRLNVPKNELLEDFLRSYMKHTLE